jgi:hypothetical protein
LLIFYFFANFLQPLRRYHSFFGIFPNFFGFLTSFFSSSLKSYTWPDVTEPKWEKEILTDQQTLSASSS